MIKKMIFTENIPGKYYVSTDCIGCALCSEIAPGIFCENTDEDIECGNNFVHKQPENIQEETLCAEAIDSCPVNAIGNNGSY